MKQSKTAEAAGSVEDQKSAGVPVQTGGTGVAVAGASAVPAFLTEQVEKYAGAGISRAQEDNIVPMLFVLQSNSPQCAKQDPKYIDGAEAGMLVLRGQAYPLVDGEKGVRVIPCFFDKDFVEWVPRKKGGGIAGRSKTMPPDAEQVEITDENGDKKQVWRRPNGNDVVETRYHTVLVLDGSGNTYPFVIPLKGTGHSFSKAWMTMQGAKKIGTTDAPAFACSYLLKSEFRSKNNNNWYQFLIDDRATEWVTPEQFHAGAKLFEDMVSGAKKMQEEDGTEHGDGSAAARSAAANEHI